LVHRQYVSASGIFAVVTIDDDWHAGQTTGVVLAGTDVWGNEFGYATGPPETALSEGWVAGTAAGLNKAVLKYTLREGLERQNLQFE